MLAPRPYPESLASSIASTSSAATIIGATGPSTLLCYKHFWVNILENCWFIEITFFPYL